MNQEKQVSDKDYKLSKDKIDYIQKLESLYGCDDHVITGGTLILRKSRLSTEDSRWPQKVRR